MKIAIKTQTSRSTQYKDNLNNVNVFLNHEHGGGDFSIGLLTTEWGESKKLENPIIQIEYKNLIYKFTLPELLEHLNIPS